MRRRADEQMSSSERGVLGFRMSAVHGLRFLRSDRCVCRMELWGPRGDVSEESVVADGMG
jgi:hypothetical protein